MKSTDMSSSKIDTPVEKQQLQDNRIARYLCGGVFLLWSITLMISQFMHPEWVRAIEGKYECTGLFVTIIIFELTVMYFFFSSKQRQLSDMQICWWIFVSALILRLGALPFGNYEPSSDFINYFAIGRDFALYGFDGTFNIADGYQIPPFAGLKVLNGIIGKIFSPTLIGFKISNCVLTSLICVMIFVVGRRLHRNGAIVSACLYCVYPCSIISSQITSNQHGSGLFLLIGIYFYDCLLQQQKINLRWFGVCVASALAFVISNFFHPSIIITLLAVSAYSLIGILGKLIAQKNISTDCKRWCVSLLAMLVLYSGISTVCMNFFESKGLYHSESTSISPLSKIVVGLNHNTMGMWNPDDYGYIGGLPEEEQVAACWEMIKERAQDVPQLIDLLTTKACYFTFEADNYFSFYTAGCTDPLEKERLALEAAFSEKQISEYEYQLEATKIEEAKNEIWRWYYSFSKADSIYLYVLSMFAVAGLIVALRKREYNTLYLLGFVYVGWSMFVTISELQTRYRYQSMPALMIFAGIGIVTLWEHRPQRKHSISTPHTSGNLVASSKNKSSDDSIV